MNIPAIPDALLQQISNNTVQNGDAVGVTLLRKALDIQTAQAAQLIDSVAESVPDPASTLGRSIDVRA